MSIGKNEKTIESYLDGLIAKAKKSWEDVDVDSYMQNLRGDSVDKEVAEKLSKEVSSYIMEQIKDVVIIRCRDLMVGDWITDEHGFPMQITNVGEDYAYATFEGLEGDPWEFDDKDYPPYPIEITKDIMRKNKWEEHSDITLKNVPEYFYVKEEGGNLIVWRSGRLFIWFNYQNSRMVADMIVPCKYVHQVQQVLRLAGMTDIANNFKI